MRSPEVLGAALASLGAAAGGDILCVGDAWWYVKTLKCKPNEDCILTCSGDHACRRASVAMGDSEVCQYV